MGKLRILAVVALGGLVFGACSAIPGLQSGVLVLSEGVTNTNAYLCQSSSTGDAFMRTSQKFSETEGEHHPDFALSEDPRVGGVSVANVQLDVDLDEGAGTLAGNLKIFDAETNKQKVSGRLDGTVSGEFNEWGGVGIVEGLYKASVGKFEDEEYGMLPGGSLTTNFLGIYATGFGFDEGDGNVRPTEDAVLALMMAPFGDAGGIGNLSTLPSVDDILNQLPASQADSIRARMEDNGVSADDIGLVFNGGIFRPSGSCGGLDWEVWAENN
ncbi:MAG TPA: hypothetical protein VFK89_07080 [Actinomycetota bacterium]|nr:hypothetical protein [Actinomycetota bacterium]